MTYYVSKTASLIVRTPQAFEDYISSLSTEQQRFAKAFRGMQLEGTLFGMVLIQIKPTMEKVRSECLDCFATLLSSHSFAQVLRLPQGSLTKEIQLTQDLMTLFTEYQIPTDLLSFDETRSSPSQGSVVPEDRLAQVKDNVARMMQMVERKKEKAARESKREQEHLESKQQAHTSSEHVTGTPPTVVFNEHLDPQEIVAMGAAIMGAQISEDSGATHNILLLDSEALLFPESGSDQEKGEDTGTSDVTDNIVSDEGENINGPAAILEEAGDSADRSSRGSSSICTEDYTQLAVSLDASIYRNNKEGAVWPTHLVLGNYWSKRFRKSVLGDFKSNFVNAEDMRRERDHTFGLIDALSRSGGLVIEHSSMHVIFAATHSFDRTLTDTVIQANINPIEKVEQTALVIASETFGEHGKGAIGRMVQDSALERLRQTHQISEIDL